VAAIDERRTDPYSERRWWVHLGLIVTFGLALLLFVARMGLTLHIIAGLCFGGLVVVHLAQRRRTLRTLASDLVRPVRWLTRRGRLAFSALVLIFLAANVIASGIVDWLKGHSVMLEVRTVGIPLPAFNWHTTTSLLLIVYVVVHVLRRLARLRHSRIR
jgi:hypothetical protein